MKKIDSYIPIDQYQQYPLDIFDHIYLIKGYSKNNQSSVMHEEVQAILKRFMPRDFVMARTPQGRPYAVSKSGKVVSFSLSHCDDNLILAVSSDQNIGLDLERLKERALSHRIAKRYFNDTRKLGLEEFYQCWTAAESLSKASDQSLWQSLHLIGRFKSPSALLEFPTNRHGERSAAIQGNVAINSEWPRFARHDVTLNVIANYGPRHDEEKSIFPEKSGFLKQPSREESEWQLGSYKISFALIGQRYMMALCRLVGNNRRLAYFGGDAE